LYSASQALVGLCMSGFVKVVGTFIQKSDLVPSLGPETKNLNLLNNTTNPNLTSNIMNNNNNNNNNNNANNNNNNSNPSLSNYHLGQCYIEPWIPKLELEHHTKILRWVLAKSFDDENVFNYFFSNAFSSPPTTNNPSIITSNFTSTPLSDHAQHPESMLSSRSLTGESRNTFLNIPQPQQAPPSNLFALAIFDQFVPHHSKLILNGVATDMKESFNNKDNEIDNSPTPLLIDNKSPEVLQFNTIVKKYSVRLIFLTLFYLGHQDITLRSKYYYLIFLLFLLIIFPHFPLSVLTLFYLGHLLFLL
jgi:hypothetical protein